MLGVRRAHQLRGAVERNAVDDDEEDVALLEMLGIIPSAPLSYWGWGEIPDQYGRRTEDDDGETPLPPDPELTDLPPLRPFWGPQPR